MKKSRKTMTVEEHQELFKAREEYWKSVVKGHDQNATRFKQELNCALAKIQKMENDMHEAMLMKQSQINVLKELVISGGLGR